jgi:hypothetical protein
MILSYVSEVKVFQVHIQTLAWPVFLRLRAS